MMTEAFTFVYVRICIRIRISIRTRTRTRTHTHTNTSAHAMRRRLFFVQATLITTATHYLARCAHIYSIDIKIRLSRDSFLLYQPHLFYLPSPLTVLFSALLFMYFVYSIYLYRNDSLSLYAPCVVCVVFVCICCQKKIT